MARVQAGQCVAQSDTQTTALIELYTADDCGACVRANRWLSGLWERDGVLPFALHVDYGDYTGTKRNAFRRQSKLTPGQRTALVYSPRVMLQGRDFRGWDTGGLDRAAAKINATTARVRIRLEIVSLGSVSMTVRAAAQPAGAGGTGAASPPPFLYLAGFETQTRRRLILEWQGPFGSPIERELALLPRAAPAQSGVAAFALDPGSREVLQALALSACPDTFGYIRPK